MVHARKKGKLEERRLDPTVERFGLFLPLDTDLVKAQVDLASGRDRLSFSLADRNTFYDPVQRYHMLRFGVRDGSGNVVFGMNSPALNQMNFQYDVIHLQGQLT